MRGSKRRVSRPCTPRQSVSESGRCSVSSTNGPGVAGSLGLGIIAGGLGGSQVVGGQATAVAGNTLQPLTMPLLPAARGLSARVRLQHAIRKPSVSVAARQYTGLPPALQLLRPDDDPLAVTKVDMDRQMLRQWRAVEAAVAESLGSRGGVSSTSGDADVAVALSLRHNLLTGLTCSPLHCVVLLDLYRNRLRCLTGLGAVSQLRVLLLAKNRLTRLDGLDAVVHLEVLDLHGNQLQHLHGLTTLKKLRILNAAGNALREVSGLSGMISLVELNLRRNVIRAIRGLHTLPKLRRLLLAHNQIFRFEDIGCVQRCPVLKELSLHHNPLTRHAMYYSTVLTVYPRVERLDDRDIDRASRHLAEQQERLAKESELTNIIFERELTNSDANAQSAQSEANTKQMHGVKEHAAVQSAKERKEASSATEGHGTGGVQLVHSAASRGRLSRSAGENWRKLRSAHQRLQKEEYLNSPRKSSSEVNHCCGPSDNQSPSPECIAIINHSCGPSDNQSPSRECITITSSPAISTQSDKHTEVHKNNFLSTVSDQDVSTTEKENRDPLENSELLTETGMIESKLINEEQGSHRVSSLNNLTLQEKPRAPITSKTLPIKPSLSHRCGSSPCLLATALPPPSFKDSDTPARSESCSDISSLNKEQVKLLQSVQQGQPLQLRIAGAPHRKNRTPLKGDCPRPQSSTNSSSGVSASLRLGKATNKIQKPSTVKRPHTANSKSAARTVSTVPTPQGSEPTSISDSDYSVRSCHSNDSSQSPTSPLVSSSTAASWNQSGSSEVKPNKKCAVIIQTSCSLVPTDKLAQNENVKTNFSPSISDIINDEKRQDEEANIYKDVCNGALSNISVKPGLCGANFSDGISVSSTAVGGCFPNYEVDSSGRYRFQNDNATNLNGVNVPVTSPTENFDTNGSLDNASNCGHAMENAVVEKSAPSGGLIRHQGSSFLAELTGGTLKLRGRSALGSLDLPWDKAAAAAATTAIFRCVDFDDAVQIFPKLRTKFQKLQNYVFDETHLVRLSQFNTLPELHKVRSITVSEVGNPVMERRDWRLYAVFRLTHWGLMVVNGIPVTDEERQEAMLSFGPLSQLAFLCLPRDHLTALLVASRNTAEGGDVEGEAAGGLAAPRLQQLIGTEALQHRRPSQQGAASSQVDSGRRCARWLVLWASECSSRLSLLETTWPAVLHDMARDALADFAKPNYGKLMLDKMKADMHINKQ